MNKKIKTMRLKAVVRDARQELKDVEEVYGVHSFWKRLRNMWGIGTFVHIRATDVQIVHKKRQIDILNGKYDKQLCVVFNEIKKESGK